MPVRPRRPCLAPVLLALFLVPAGAAPAATRPAHAAELDLGSHSYRVTTRSAAAQRAFDRGLTLAYGFSHGAAEREFRRAAQLDSTCAMAWWGVALVNGPHINFPLVPPDKAATAWDALTRARRLAPGASPRERALIEALAARYADPQPEDRRPLDVAYADAMRRVAREYPRDADIAALFAESMMDLRPWDLWTAGGQPQPGTEEIEATLERALQLEPRHPGANHYYIHVMEASPHPERAQVAADRLRAGLVPGASHMVHMPAHIDARVGRWDRAMEANARARAADEAYRAAYPRPGFYAMYMAHNDHFYAWAAMMRGRSVDALAAARAMAATVPEEFLRDYAGVVDGYMAFVPEVMMRFGLWQQVLDEPAPPDGLPLAHALWRYTRTAALLALGRGEDARAERTAFDSAAAAVPRDATFGNNRATDLLDIAARVLDGEAAAARGGPGDLDSAAVALREAARIEDGLRYDEPPDWMQPTRHTLGAVLMRAQRHAEAERVYREDLARNPENGWALFGLGRALRMQGRTKEAAAVEARFRRVWKDADVQLASTCFCQPPM